MSLREKISSTPIRLAIYLSIIVMLLIALITFSYVNNERNKILNNSHNEVLSALKQHGYYLLSQLEIIDFLLQRLEIRINRLEVTQQDIHLLSEMIADDKNLLSNAPLLLITNTNAEILLSSNLITPATNLTKLCPPFPHDAEATVTLISNWKNQNSSDECENYHTIYFSRRLFNRHGHFKGELVALLSNEMFSGFIMGHLSHFRSPIFYEVLNAQGESLLTDSQESEADLPLRQRVEYQIPGFAITLQLHYSEPALLQAHWHQLRNTTLMASLLLFIIWIMTTLLIVRTLNHYQRRFKLEEERLATAMQFAEVDVWDWNIAADEIHFSENKNLYFDASTTEQKTLQTILQRIHVDDRDQVMAAIDRTLQTLQVFDTIHRIYTPSGNICWVHERGNVITNHQGKATRMLGIVQDITAQMAAKDQLQYQNMLYQTLFDGITDALILTDTERNIINTNHGFRQIFGYSSDEVLGKKTAYLYESIEAYQRQGEIRYNLSAEEQLAPYLVTYRRK
ncbi:MAG: PAS domain S-box protein, partial [Gammaproteobacteria bacterium]|nr:PAS domain S-box protein [Gammaproteobacteria bacterium]